jgi:CubicO group peptidase (beta-lactamase class C family)
VTGKTLNDYMHANIFKPLGLDNISMIPTASMRSKMAYMHARQHDGSLRQRDHLQRLPIVVDLEDKAAIGKVFNSGGAGLYAKPQEYARTFCHASDVSN